MTAQASIPLKWYVPFANNDSSRVELPVTTSDPTRASQSLGFPPLTMQPPESGGVPPQGEDFNGGMNQVARICWWLLNGGGYPFDSIFASNSNINGYPNGATLQSADFLGQWISTADNNQNNPDTGSGAAWVPGFQYGTTSLTGLTGGTVTPTPAQAAKKRITLSGALTSALTVVLPIWIKNWTITNNTTGAFVTIVKTAAGSGVTIPNGGNDYFVRGDGTSILSATAVTAGSLLRTSVYTLISGVQNVSVNGGTPTTTGATTFTSLAATTKVVIEAQGGGSGGGGVSTNGTQPAGGGGGGAGAYGRGVYTSAFSGGISVTVGAGGTGGAAGNNFGSVGTATSVGALISCPPGFTGTGGAPTTAPFFNGGTAPSAAPTGANVISAPGGPGQFAIVLGNSNVGGGMGGVSFFGAGGGAASNTAGTNAANPGSGGGGASAFSALNINQAGGAGAAGIVIIYEYA